MCDWVTLCYFKVLECKSVSGGHELANSFLLFSVHKSFLQIIKIFSLRHRLHFLLILSYGLQVASTFHCTRNGFFTLDLPSGSYKPYMKPNNKLLYVHQQSNHPPALKKNIPLNINKRLSNISSSNQPNCAYTTYHVLI